MNNNSNEPRRPIWFYVLIVVIAIGFGVPLLQFLGDIVSSVASILVLALIALLLYRLLKKSEKIETVLVSEIQTCSDIQSLDIKLGAGRFVIEQGDSFKIDGGKIKSYIEKGIWHISSELADDLPDTGRITTITVPSLFTANNAAVKLGAGNLLIKGLSAYEMTLEVSAGNMEAIGLYAKQLSMKCGVGRIKADAGMHGDVDISCGVGETTLSLTNRAEEFNYTASVGLGKVVVAENEVNVSGQTSGNTAAAYNLNIKCGMGSVKVDFGGASV